MAKLSSYKNARYKNVLKSSIIRVQFTNYKNKKKVVSYKYKGNEF